MKDEVESVRTGDAEPTIDSDCQPRQEGAKVSAAEIQRLMFEHRRPPTPAERAILDAERKHGYAKTSASSVKA
jgi:hypothetical protein